ncbi:AAA family ATPase [Muribaculum sp. An289]|uniref:ATP-binding protein n=1 Tax=unclassified Muribaculum TaxID=2622126 RepID=UPI000B37C620|nr:MULTISPECIES: AAA family ATPase [unclassified Muribaculum]OUO37205.1 AAA family ATPase [Muribaculum sp. An289]OUO43152.1 AAA family ATPase [Muribaculum sp. An287]
MDYTDIQPLINIYHRKLAATDLRFKRYLHYRIDWDVRLIGIKGARGVGKTTMLLQHIKESFDKIDDALYVSLDNLWFNTHKLEELVEFLYTHGVMHIYLDEVHRYKDWAVLLKNFYDSYPDLNIVYTGSAMLAIDNSKADLSRRQSLYTLNGLSFREYLACEGVAAIPTIGLEEMLAGHVEYAVDVISGIKILKYFDKYLREGYYPYYKEAGNDYLMRVGEVARLVIDNDIPSVEDITYFTAQKIKTLLMVIAGNVPLKPNISKLSSQLESTRDQTLKMLYLLDRADLLLLLTEQLKNYKHLVSPKKIYLNNANLMYALSGKISEGTVRETFFANQVGAVADLTMPKQGDFLADGKYLFEVGGSSKTFDQIAGIPESYLAVDGIETGSGNRIPLWMFGCMY